MKKMEEVLEHFYKIIWIPWLNEVGFYFFKFSLEKNTQRMFFLKKKLKINLILGPDNVDGSKYIHEVNYIYLLLLISN